MGDFTEPQRHFFTTSLCVFVDQVKISPTSEPEHLPASSLPHLHYFIILWFLAAGWLPDLTWAALFGLETSPAAQLTSSQINSQWQLLSSRRRNGCDKARIVDVIKENRRTRLTFEIHLAENPTHSLLFQSRGNREAVKSSHPTKTLKSCTESRTVSIKSYSVTIRVNEDEPWGVGERFGTRPFSPAEWTKVIRFIQSSNWTVNKE